MTQALSKKAIAKKAIAKHAASKTAAKKSGGTMPAQEQDRQPGREREMRPQPDYEPKVAGSGRLRGKVALITGGDSGIGRAIAVAMAREGADVAILYLEEEKDAADTAKAVEDEGRTVLKVAGDVGDETFCREAVEKTVARFGRIDILVNNAAEQHETDDIREIDAKQIERTFRTNIFSFFYMTKHALRHMSAGGAIINTASITAYRGHKTLLDYSATKGAIVAFTRSLSQALIEDGIRVNAVAPGPIWTPLIPASFDAEHVANHGKSAPMHRPGQPNEVAPCYVFLASEEASYISGQVLHPNGGSMVAS
ncbi:MAG: SDR family oxidoreductase [Xanthobacteraceae bacterium]|uniref:SDR family oxidoreductase n=1 Tax=Pseudolabrys sp. TaxID=1960880 RepID=UPI003D0C9D40